MKYRWSVEGTKNGYKTEFQGITETNLKDRLDVKMKVIKDVEQFFERLFKAADANIEADLSTLKFQKEGE